MAGIGVDKYLEDLLKYRNRNICENELYECQSIWSYCIPIYVHYNLSKRVMGVKVILSYFENI